MNYTEALTITRAFMTIIATRKATEAEKATYAKAAATLNAR